jgi:hypothetical protein
MRLSELLDDVRAEAPPPRYDVEDAVRAGKRLRRHRRAGVVAAAVVAVAIAIGVPQLTRTASAPPPVPPAAPTPSPSVSPAAVKGPALTYTLHGFTTGKLRVADPYRWTIAGETAMIDKKGGQPDAAEGEVTLYRAGIDPRTTLAGAKITASAAVHGRPAYRVDADGAPMLLWEYTDNAMALATVRADGPGRWALTPAELRQVAEGLKIGPPQPVPLAFGTSYLPPGLQIVEVAGRFSEGQLSSAMLAPTADAQARIGQPDPDPRTGGGRGTLMFWLAPAVSSDHGSPRPGVQCPAMASVKGTASGTHCFVFAPGGKYVLEVFGSSTDDPGELKQILGGARFADVTKPSTWLAARTGFPASAQVGG